MNLLVGYEQFNVNIQLREETLGFVSVFSRERVKIIMRVRESVSFTKILP